MTIHIQFNVIENKQLKDIPYDVLHQRMTIGLGQSSPKLDRYDIMLY